MTMDFITDQNPTALYEVGIKAGSALPEYVANAPVLQAEDVASLHDLAFADTRNRLFPVHTKAAAYMSAVYLAGKGDTSSAVFNRVKSTCDFFGISDDVNNAIALLPSADATEKSASTLCDTAYALKFNIEEQDTWAAYPIGNSVAVVKSALDLIKDWNTDHIPADWYFKAAANIVKKANELGIQRNDLPAKLWADGEERLVDFAAAEESILTRKYAGVEDTSQYTETLKAAASGTISVEAALDEWMMLDAANSINHKKIGSPHEAFYSGPRVADVEKMAAETVIIKDVMVPAEAVIKLASEAKVSVTRAFRKEVAESIISIAESLRNVNSKSAAIATASIDKMEDVHKTELLKLLIAVA